MVLIKYLTGTAYSLFIVRITLECVRFTLNSNQTAQRHRKFTKDTTVKEIS